MARACLVDVYDTIVKSDYIPRAGVLTSFLGVDIDTWELMWFKTADSIWTPQFLTVWRAPRSLAG